GSSLLWINLYFLFQAEDGIRDKLVTGVQTCALPILSAIIFSTRGRSAVRCRWPNLRIMAGADSHSVTTISSERFRRLSNVSSCRSEERRVGKGGRARWLRGH